MGALKMPQFSVTRVLVPAIAVMAAPAFANAASTAAAAGARAMTGSGWVALGILGVLVWVVYLVIRGALHLENRDGRLHRGGRVNDSGWFGAIPYNSDDDEDAPDLHHHDGG